MLVASPRASADEVMADTAVIMAKWRASCAFGGCTWPVHAERLCALFTEAERLDDPAALHARLVDGFMETKPPVGAIRLFTQIGSAAPDRKLELWVDAFAANGVVDYRCPAMARIVHGAIGITPRRLTLGTQTIAELSDGRLPGGGAPSELFAPLLEAMKTRRWHPNSVRVTSGVPFETFTRITRTLAATGPKRVTVQCLHDGSECPIDGSEPAAETGRLDEVGRALFTWHGKPTSKQEAAHELYLTATVTPTGGVFLAAKGGVLTEDGAPTIAARHGRVNDDATEVKLRSIAQVYPKLRTIRITADLEADTCGVDSVARAARSAFGEVTPLLVGLPDVLHRRATVTEIMKTADGIAPIAR